jgi:hypothetical protein
MNSTRIVCRTELRRNEGKNAATAVSAPSERNRPAGRDDCQRLSRQDTAVRRENLA